MYPCVSRATKQTGYSPHNGLKNRATASRKGCGKLVSSSRERELGAPEPRELLEPRTNVMATLLTLSLFSRLQTIGTEPQTETPFAHARTSEMFANPLSSALQLAPLNNSRRWRKSRETSFPGPKRTRARFQVHGAESSATSAAWAQVLHVYPPFTRLQASGQAVGRCSSPNRSGSFKHAACKLITTLSLSLSLLVRDQCRPRLDVAVR